MYANVEEEKFVVSEEEVYASLLTLDIHESHALVM